MLWNDVEIDNYTLIYFPVFTLLNELLIPIYFEFLLLLKILIIHSLFS